MGRGARGKTTALLHDWRGGGAPRGPSRSLCALDAPHRGQHPEAALEQALAFRAAPSILIETERDYAAAWRLHNPVEAYVAGLLAKAVAEALGGVPLPFILPLPGSAGVGRHQYLKGPSNWTLQTDLIRRAPQPAEPAAEAVKAPAPFRPSAPAVMLGARKAGGDVFWAPFENEAKLLNSGVLVTGDPGSGKTQTLNVLIDGVAGMGSPVCIFDFKNDYSERGFVQAIGLKVHDVRRQGLPFNPLMPSFNADGPGPAHRAHLHHRGRAESRVRPRRPPGMPFCARP